MSSFNAELWRQRSWARYQKFNSNKEMAERQWQSDLRAIDQMEKTVSWCNDRDLKVVFCRRSAAIYLGQHRMIRISDRLMPRLQSYFMLHECGHFLIGARDRDDRFGMGWHTEDEADKKTFHHRCDIVEEEFEAWYRGWRLARRLKLNIVKEDYDNVRIRQIKTYLCWALKVKGYGSAGVAPDFDVDQFDKLELQTAALTG